MVISHSGMNVGYAIR